jgi:periplasmic protein TonB
MSSAPTGLHDQEDRRAWVGWSLAAAVMLAAHVGVVAGYLALHRPIADLAAAPIVTVEFVSPSAEPSSQPADVAPAQDATPPEPVEEAKLQPVPPAEAPPVPPPPMETMPQPEPPVQAAVTPKPVEEMPQPELPAPAQKPVDRAAPAVERPKVETAIPPPTRPHPKAEPEERKKPVAKPVAAARPQTTRVAALPVNQDVASAGANDGRAAWRGELIAQLARAKRYPAAAAAEHQTGTVQLSFTMNRNGRVLSRHILRSSGSPALDEEALAMVERAQPLPPFPPSMPQAQISLNVPVSFSLR